MKRLSADARVLVFLCVLMLAVLLASTAGNDEQSGYEFFPRRTTYSVQPGGLEAFYLALTENGMTASRLTQPWTSLHEQPGILFCLSPPFSPTDDEWDALANWVRAGNVAVLAGAIESGFHNESDQSWTDVTCPLHDGFLSGVNSFHVYKNPPKLANFAPPRRDVLWNDAGPVADVARWAPVGRGGVWLVSNPEIAANDAIAVDDNLRFLLNVCGDRPVIFDEYHHGYRVSSGLWDMLPNPTRFGLVYLGLGGLVLCWALSRRLGAPIADRLRTHERQEFVDSLAELLRRARAVGLVARTRRRRLRTRFAQLLGVPGATDEDLVAAAASRNEAASRVLADVLKRLGTPDVTADELARLARKEDRIWKELSGGRT